MRQTEFFRSGDGEYEQDRQQEIIRMTAIGIGRKEGGRQFQERNMYTIQDLLSYVNQNFFVGSLLTMKQLQNLTQKQFSTIFWGLMKTIDPCVKPDNYSLEDIPQFMKFWSYPYPLNKNIFQTLGAPHIWQHIQTLLLWIYSIVRQLQSNSENQKQQQQPTQKRDMEILNAFITKSFKKRDNNNQKMNSSKKSPPLSKINQSPIDEDKEAKEVADKLKQRGAQMQEQMKELEMKIETIKLGNKNLCMKQPELTEIENKIEQQNDLIGMEQEIINELSHENEEISKEVDKLSVKFNQKLNVIYQLGVEKKNIMECINEQSFSISDAEKKVKEIERMNKEKQEIELQISKLSDERQNSLSNEQFELSELNQIVKEYNDRIANSNELFIQCSDILVSLNKDRLNAQSIQQLYSDQSINDSQIDQPQQLRSNLTQPIQNANTNISNKQLKKKLIRSFINIPFKQASNLLQGLIAQYQQSSREKEENFKQIFKQTEDKKNKISDIEIKANQLQVKLWQKNEELKQLTTEIQERQQAFKNKNEEDLQQIATLNIQLNQIKQYQGVQENELSYCLSNVEIRNAQIQKEKEDMVALIETQLQKVRILKGEIAKQLGQLKIGYQNLALSQKNN